MNKSDLINALKDYTGLSRKDAELVVDQFFGAITEAVGAGDRVEIRGFGSFSVKEYKAYTGRNPKTGSQIEVPGWSNIIFTTGNK